MLVTEQFQTIHGLNGHCSTAISGPRQGQGAWQLQLPSLNISQSLVSVYARSNPLSIIHPGLHPIPRPPNHRYPRKALRRGDETGRGVGYRDWDSTSAVIVYTQCVEGTWSVQKEVASTEAS